MAKTAFLFPGQGSQFVGMGLDFHKAHEWARDLFALADEVTAKPISRLCFEGPLEELTRTVNLQPAITAMNLVCLQALLDKGLEPQVTAGHSLGEYSALAASGVISTADALRLVNTRGELMQRDADRRPGSMQAVIGLSREEVEGLAELAKDHGPVVVANHNTPQQLVITGKSAAVAALAKLAKAKGARTVPLPVSGAWHSPLMHEAAADFAAVLEQTVFSPPAREIILNVTAEKEPDPDRIKAVMARQITSPVRWSGIIEKMLKEGVTDFVEVGPKKVLAGLVKKIVPREAKVKIINVQDQAGVDLALEKLSD
ncbi:MAG: ACP S-malonyltransferase [Thermodesulfobacteriota bacterium]|nr:ACP S-malonyltransferase [Thermodesulfobacteriota bacterium]